MMPFHRPYMWKPPAWDLIINHQCDLSLQIADSNISREALALSPVKWKKLKHFTRSFLVNIMKIVVYLHCYTPRFDDWSDKSQASSHSSMPWYERWKVLQCPLPFSRLFLVQKKNADIPRRWAISTPGLGGGVRWLPKGRLNRMGVLKGIMKWNSRMGHRIHGTDIIYLHGGFLKWRYPKFIHFNRVFHCKPSILGYHNFRKPPHEHHKNAIKYMKTHTKINCSCG